MDWLRWPLLFFIAYGVLWLRQEFYTVRTKNSDVYKQSHTTNTAKKLLEKSKYEDPNSDTTLAYAFQKVAKQSRMPQYDFNHLKSNKQNTKRFLEEAELQLENLQRDKLLNRTLILNEVVGINDSNNLEVIENILAKERKWISKEIEEIPNSTELHNYIHELFRLSLMVDTGSISHGDLLSEFTPILERRPEVVPSLYHSIENYAPWELENWKSNLDENQLESINRFKKVK